MDEIELEVISILRELEIPAHLKGYEFIKNAMKYLLTNPGSIHRLTTELYKEVGKMDIDNNSSSKVERGIRVAIGSAAASSAVWHRVLGRSGPMSNGAFLAALLEEVKIKRAFAEQTKKPSAPTEDPKELSHLDCTIDLAKVEPLVDREMAEEVLRKEG